MTHEVAPAVFVIHVGCWQSVTFTVVLKSMTGRTITSRVTFSAGSSTIGTVALKSGKSLCLEQHVAAGVQHDQRNIQRSREPKGELVFTYANGKVSSWMVGKQEAIRLLSRLFDRLRAEGNTIVLVTHKHDIAEYAHRIIHIRDDVVTKMKWRAGNINSQWSVPSRHCL